MIKKFTSMGSKAGLASVLTAALALGGTSGAFAVEGGAVTTTPIVSATPTATPALGGPHKRAVAAFKVAKDEFKAKMAAFKAERITYTGAVEAYRVIEKAYKTARRAIAVTFRNTVGPANAAFKVVRENSASTIEQLSAAKATRDAVIATATTARDTAITALGAVPVQPPKPLAPTE